MFNAFLKYLNYDIWKYFWKRIEQYYRPMRSMRSMRYWNKPCNFSYLISYIHIALGSCIISVLRKMNISVLFWVQVSPINVYGLNHLTTKKQRLTSYPLICRCCRNNFLVVKPRKSFDQNPFYSCNATKIAFQYWMLSISMFWENWR